MTENRSGTAERDPARRSSRLPPPSLRGDGPLNRQIMGPGCWLRQRVRSRPPSRNGTGRSPSWMPSDGGRGQSVRTSTSFETRWICARPSGARRCERNQRWRECCCDDSSVRWRSGTPRTRRRPWSGKPR